VPNPESIFTASSASLAAAPVPESVRAHGPPARRPRGTAGCRPGRSVPQPDARSDTEDREPRPGDRRERRNGARSAPRARPPQRVGPVAPGRQQFYGRHHVRHRRLGRAHRAGEVRHLRLGHAPHGDPAVLGLVEASPERRPLRLVSHQVAQHPVHGQRGHVTRLVERCCHGQRGLDGRHRHPAGSAQQRADHTGRQQQAGAVVVHHHVAGTGPGVSALAHLHAGRRLHDVVEGRPSGQRALDPEPLGPGVDQAWVHCAERRLVEAETLPDPGHGVLDDDVGGSHEVAQADLVTRVLEVENESALGAVAVDVDVGQDRHHQEPALAARRLHLHHVGAELGQEARGQRTRPEAREVDDAVAGQGALLAPVPSPGPAAASHGFDADGRAQ
jgi:hypothetical protein